MARPGVKSTLRFHTHTQDTVSNEDKQSHVTELWKHQSSHPAFLLKKLNEQGGSGNGGAANQTNGTAVLYPTREI